MFTLFGIIFLLLALASCVFLFIVRREGEGEAGSYNYKPASPEIIQKLADVKITVGSFIISLVLLFGVNGAFFVADGTEQYGVQYIWGTKVAVREPGLKFKGWGKLIPVGNEIVVKYVIPDDEGNYPDNSEFTTVIPAIEWEFNDAVKGEVATTVVVNTREMSDEQFLDLVFNVRSEKNLVFSRIVPAMNAALKTSAKLMGAQDYMSGKSSDFDYYFKDQLINGAYRLEETAAKTGNKSVVLDSVATTVGTDVIADEAQPKSKIYTVLERNGSPVRQEENTVFSKYSIQVITAVAEDVDWEDKFDTRLDKQKALVADIQERKRGAEKEYYARLEEEQKGEKEKVAEQKRLEKEQIQKTIAAETKVLEAQQLVEEEKYKQQAAQIAAKTLRVQKDAEAYANRLLVNAGLTPQERAKIDKEIAIGVATQIAKLKLPNTVILGAGGKGNDGLLTQLLGAKFAESLIPKTGGN